MKHNLFFKRALIITMGLAIVLTCGAQTSKEKRAERNESRKSERTKNFETLGSLISSRNFVFRSGETESRQIRDLTEKHEYGTSEIIIDGPLVRISGLNSSEWWKTTSGRINAWELTRNQDEFTYSISFIAHSDDSDTGVLIKIFSDKTAVAQFGGREFRGRVAPN